MKSIAAKYGAFVRQPDVARLLFVALLSRMPIGMVGFAMLMFLRDSLGNFALAGTAVGINFIAMAACAPIQGRLIDRHGPRILLLVTGVVQPAALAGVLVAASAGAAYWVTALCAGIAGVFASPITTITRTMWRTRFDREEDRRTAFALDSVTIEINFTLGPALVAGVLGAWGTRAAFALSILVVAASVAIYVGSGVLALFHNAASGERHLLGPLTEPRLWLVFVATFGLTVCFGFLEVGYPAYATFLATPALAGILLAINSIGSAIGGGLYGGMHFRMTVERQFACAMALMAVPLALHAMVLQPVVVFAVVAFFAGALIAPSITAQSVLVSRFAPARYATEAFTWSTTFIVSGIGAGMAVGGAMVESVGLRPTFALGAAIMTAMALGTLVLLSPDAPEEVRASD
jgi:MFS family permease